MGVSIFYECTAPANTPASELEPFLHDVEHEAKSPGFDQTDTPERREFANRLGGNFMLQDERLKGVAMPATPSRSRIRRVQIIPPHGVVLVVIDVRGCEACFGVLPTPGAHHRHPRPDPCRYRFRRPVVVSGFRGFAGSALPGDCREVSGAGIRAVGEG